MKKVLAVVVLAGLVAWYSLSGSGREVTASEFGDEWPFTVTKGRVDCVKGLAYTFEANGVVYGLNGFADSWLETEDLKQIWARDPRYPDLQLYISIDAIQKAAEAEC